MQRFWIFFLTIFSGRFFGGAEGRHHHHNGLRPYRQSSYYSGTNRNPTPAGSWPPIGGHRRHVTNYNPNNLPECPPEEVVDEELEFGNNEFYKVNKFTKCAPPAFPAPPASDPTNRRPGAPEQQHQYPTPRMFQRLHQAPTRAPPGQGQGQGQPPSGAYYDPYRPATPSPPPYYPPPPPVTESYYPPMEVPPYRPYPTQATRPTDAPYRPGLTEPTLGFRTERPPYPPPVTEAYISTKRYQGDQYSEKPTQSPYVKPTQIPYFTQNPTQNPYVTQNPTQNPYFTQNPTQNHYFTQNPTQNPYFTQNPTQNPYFTQNPTQNPYVTQNPTQNPYFTQNPTQNPYVTPNPTQNPYGTQKPVYLPPKSGQAFPRLEGERDDDYFDREKNEGQVSYAASAILILIGTLLTLTIAA